MPPPTPTMPPACPPPMARALLAGLLLGLPAAAQAFGLAAVATRAQALAATAYVKPTAELPKELRQLAYEDYQRIRYQPERAWWRGEGLPFELTFFHPGMYFDQPVKINEVVRKRIREIRYQPEAFDFGGLRPDPRKLAGLGFAGFRVHYPLNTPRYKDEALVFLGASYFRALGRGQAYGLSARALAIDTALAGGEEFPHFREFWIERPAANARELTIYALLDSPRATGAYRFILRPGAETGIEVKARLYLRAEVGKFGLAPLTSMYYFGENQRPDHDDYRPEVHDSDGLAVHAGNGEWIWRPLVNPRRLLVTSFATVDPAGFGLQQRDRCFASYQEMAARYELRPGGWIEPRGRWGAGRVELVQIPTPDETNDNVVAFWVPEKAPPPGQPFDLEYRVLWQKESEARPPLLWVAQTRRGRGYLPRPDDGSLYLTVDFAGAPPAAGRGELRAAVHVDGNGEVRESRLERNEAAGGWRLSLRLRRVDAARATELRAFLQRDEQPVSETWSYILPPD